VAMESPQVYLNGKNPSGRQDRPIAFLIIVLHYVWQAQAQQALLRFARRMVDLLGHRRLCYRYDALWL
jgi:hypothetical protein